MAKMASAKHFCFPSNLLLKKVFVVFFVVFNGELFSLKNFQNCALDHQPEGLFVCLFPVLACFE
jgi:hypothetical protein